MKKVILIMLLISIPIFSFSQNREKLQTVNPIYEEFLPLRDGKITYSKVVSVEGVSKDEIFIRANEWIIKAFNSSEDVIQLNDKEAGKIVCKTLTKQSAGRGLNSVIMDLYYLLTIEIRDGRYKITASDFVHHYDVILGRTRQNGDNPFEQYFLLKEPTKKELKLNMEIAQKLSIFINAVFVSAEIEISSERDDDW